MVYQSPAQTYFYQKDIIEQPCSTLRILMGRNSLSYGCFVEVLNIPPESNETRNAGMPSTSQTFSAKRLPGWYELLAEFASDAHIKLDPKSYDPYQANETNQIFSCVRVKASRLA